VSSGPVAAADARSVRWLLFIAPARSKISQQPMTSFGPVIARRRLRRIKSKSPVIVEIGVPRQRKTGEWECPYRIRGIKAKNPQRALGEDAVQALELVLQWIRLELEPHSSSLTWTGEPGEIGFHQFYPDIFGPVVRRRVTRLIDRELAREGRRLKRRKIGLGLEPKPREKSRSAAT
jgi:hypothetical protein